MEKIYEGKSIVINYDHFPKRFTFMHVSTIILFITNRLRRLLDLGIRQELSNYKKLFDSENKDILDFRVSFKLTVFKKSE